MIMESQMGDCEEAKKVAKNNVSAIVTGAFGLGSIMGPIIASLLEAATDFRWAFTIISLLVLVVSVLQFHSAFLFKSS